MYSYEVIKEDCMSTIMGYYTTYSIRITKKQDYTVTDIDYIFDVTTDSQVALKLSSICTKLDLDPVHIYEVIDDMVFK